MAGDKDTSSNAPAVWVPEDNTEYTSDKLRRKGSEMPFIPIGFAGLVGVCAYGAYSYSNRGPMSTSRYLMRLRVLAQSCVVGAIVVGAGIAAFKGSPRREAN